MMENYTEKLLAYLDGDLSASEQAALENQLAATPALQSELEALKHLNTMIEQDKEMEPPQSLDQRFSDFLISEKQVQQFYQTNQRKKIRQLSGIYKIAAAVALLVMAGGFGWILQRNQFQQKQINNLYSEVTSTRKMLLLSMLEKQSASERIKALNTASQTGHDPEIAEALIKTLNTDKNVNVRIKAAEALLTFTNDPAIKQALAKSLNLQESPEVQIVLIDILVTTNTRQAIEEFHRLVKDKDRMEIVRKKAADGLEILL